MLGRHFALTHRELPVLSEELLRPLDALLLCTTEGPALSEAELEALRSRSSRSSS